MTCAAVLALAGSVALDAASDTLALAPVGPGRAVLCYYNDVRQLSGGGEFTVTADGLAVRVRIRVEAGPERIIIEPPEGWFVYPADAAEQGVDDGAEIVVDIMGGTS